MHNSISGAVRAFSRRHTFSRVLGRRLGMLGLSLMLLVPGQPLLAHEYEIGDLELVHPWSRATPEGARVAAGYVLVRNSGSAPDRLLSAEAEIAERAEIHEMAVDAEGVMTMRALPDGLEIPAGGEAELKPGSYHIMFLGLNRGVREGERFRGTLTFEKAGTVDVEYAVEAMGGGSGHDHHDHGLGGHEEHGG